MENGFTQIERQIEKVIGKSKFDEDKRPKNRGMYWGVKFEMQGWREKFVRRCGRP